MFTRKSYSKLSPALPALVLTIVLAQACGGDDNEKPGNPPVNNGGRAGASGAGGRGGRGGGGSSGSAGTGETEGGHGGSIADAGEGQGATAGQAGDAGSGGGGTEPPPVCDDPNGPDGCYACEPTDGESLQFLNRCSDSQCSKFDNAARIPGFTGTLPRL